jgi:hypothetical protein
MQSIFSKLFKKRVLLLILVFGSIIRVGILIANIKDNYPLFHNNPALIKEQINVEDKPYQHPFGSEISNVAYSIVCKGEGFASPFGGHTGPTGWVAPGMVFLYVLAFYLFGCFTFGSILFVFILSLVLSLLMISIIYSLCVKLFRREMIGYIGACLFAIDPHDIFIFKRIHQQDFNTLTFLFLLVFYLFICCTEASSIKKLIVVALASGIATLFNPVFIVPIIMLLFLLLKEKIFTLKYGVIFAIVAFLIVTPYIVYQKQKLKTWTFIKINGPFEIYQGNKSDFFGVLTFDLFKKYHPIMNQKEFEEYKIKGEMDYIHSKFVQFKNNFDLKSFLLLSIKKYLYFFFIYPPLKMRDQGIPVLMYFAYSLRGLSLLIYLFIRAKRITTYDKFLYFYIVSYAIPYCFAGIMYRYSFPIVPLSTVLAAYIIYMLWQWIKTGVGKTSVVRVA